MTSENKNIITIFVGSVRNGRMGDKVAKWIAKILEQRKNFVHLIDPLEYDELLVLKVPNHYNPKPSSQMQQLHQWLDESDGFILVTPEYNHSFSGAIKNSLDNFMPEYKNKPFGIASYSSGPFGGIRANEALRQVVSELKGVPTPIPFIMSTVQDNFDESGNIKNEIYNVRLIEFLDDFDYYVKLLRNKKQVTA